jgi:hypothetical protein
MSETWQVDIATSESDRNQGRVMIAAYSPSFDRRVVALVNRKEDAARIVAALAAQEQAAQMRKALVEILTACQTEKAFSWWGYSDVAAIRERLIGISTAALADGSGAQGAGEREMDRLSPCNSLHPGLEDRVAGLTCIRKVGHRGAHGGGGEQWINP